MAAKRRNIRLPRSKSKRMAAALRKYLAAVKKKNPARRRKSVTIPKAAIAGKSVTIRKNANGTVTVRYRKK